MTRSWAWVCLLLLLVTASAAAIPSSGLAHRSMTLSTSPSSTERPQILVAPLKRSLNVRKDQRSSAEDETRLEALHGRQQDDLAQNQMRARQQLLPFVEIPLPVATLTVVRTVTVEVASQTSIIFQPFVQTLTFINPVLVFETHAVTASQPLKTIVARGKTNTAAVDQESHLVALPVDALRPEETAVSSRSGRIRRQAWAPVTRVSTTTVETTTTLTNFGSIRTITVFNPVFVSVTVDQTVTTTSFTTTLSTGTTASLPQADPTSSSGEDDRPTNMTTFSSTFTGGLRSTGTTTFFVPSETSANAGVTTRFPTPSDPVVQRSTESTAASTTESGSDSTATAAPNGATAAPAPEPASEPDLSPGTIASISLGAITGLLFLLFLGYVYRSYRNYAKDPRNHRPSKEDYQMTSATAATAIMNRAAVASPNHNGQGRTTPGEASGKSADEAKQIRIVIRPVMNRQSEGVEGVEAVEVVEVVKGGEVEPRRSGWQRASGYTSEGGYSVSVAAGSDSTLRDATGWSNRSEYGSTTKRAASQDGDIPELPAPRGAAQMKDRQ